MGDMLLRRAAWWTSCRARSASPTAASRSPLRPGCSKTRRCNPSLFVSARRCECGMAFPLLGPCPSCDQTPPHPTRISLNVCCALQRVEGRPGASMPDVNIKVSLKHCPRKKAFCVVFACLFLRQHAGCGATWQLSSRAGSGGRSAGQVRREHQLQRRHVGGHVPKSLRRVQVGTSVGPGNVALARCPRCPPSDKAPMSSKKFDRPSLITFLSTEESISVSRDRASLCLVSQLFLVSLFCFSLSCL